MSVATLPPIEIVAASFFSTHHASAADALARRERPTTQPAFGLLVGRARRFTSLATQMHLEVIGALPPRVDAPAPRDAVFATCHGEIQTAENLIADLHANAMVSSARFALSVHNTPSGLYSVATHSDAPSTTITGANAIAAGWLEAALSTIDTGRTVLLSIADEPVPPVFEGPPGTTGVAAAFLIAPAGAGGCRVQLSITQHPGAEVEHLQPPEPLDVLAAATARCTGDRSASTTLSLGPIQARGTLELHFHGGAHGG